METNKRILKKVAKCLRLAKSSNPHEAASAMRQAQKLMAKHDISAEEVSMADVSERSTSTGSRCNAALWVVNLSSLINDAFGTTCFSQSYWDKPTQMTFVGVDPAPEIASYAFNVLHRQLKKERAAYYKKLRGKRVNKIRKADLFALSWLRSVKATVIKFAGTDNSEVINNYLAVHHRGLATIEKSIKPNKTDYNHIVNGSLAGKGVSLNHAMNGSAGVGRLS